MAELNIFSVIKEGSPLRKILIFSGTIRVLILNYWIKVPDKYGSFLNDQDVIDGSLLRTSLDFHRKMIIVLEEH